MTVDEVHKKLDDILVKVEKAENAFLTLTARCITQQREIERLQNHLKYAKLELSIANECVMAYRAGLEGKPEPRGMSEAGIDAFIHADAVRKKAEGIADE